MEQFYQWDERHLAIGELSTSYLESYGIKVDQSHQESTDALAISPSSS